MEVLSSVLTPFSAIVNNANIMIWLFALAAFLFVYRLTPVVVHVALKKRLSTPINERSSHDKTIPAFGGVPIFAVLILFTSFVSSVHYEPLANWMVVSFMIMFGVGFKDDLLIIAPKTKFYGQFLASLVVIFHPSLIISNLHGFLFIHHLPEYAAIFFALFFMLALNNAFNLIDGIDGLASSVAIIVSTFFAFYFWMVKDLFYVYLCSCVVGALLAFLIFNFAGGIKKIFLGDCGSLVLGLFLGIMSLRFLASAGSYDIQFTLPENKFLIVLALLIVPILDTARVIFIRLKKGQSPFYPDRNHMHHLVVDWLGSHKKATLFIVSVNALCIGVIFILSNYLTWVYVMIALCLMYAALLMALGYIVKLNKNVSKVRERRHHPVF